jgi:hypothetical protein
MKAIEYFKNQRSLNHTAYLSGLQTVEEFTKNATKLYYNAVEDLVREGYTLTEALNTVSEATEVYNNKFIIH